MAINTASKKFTDVPRVLRDYLNFMTVIKGKSENTVKEYYYDLRMFLRFVFALERSLDLNELNNIDLTEFNEDLLKEITLSDLYEFMAYVNNEKSSNDNYRARKVASLKSFFKYFQ